MKKLFLSIACLTALAAVNADALFGRNNCGGGGCAPKVCASAPKCEERVCFMEKCGPACVKPDECTETREIAYRNCTVMVPEQRKYPVEIVCRTTTKCVTNEVPLAGCGEEATHFSNGAPVNDGRYSAYGAEAGVAQKAGSRAARKAANSY